MQRFSKLKNVFYLMSGSAALVTPTVAAAEEADWLPEAVFDTGASADAPELSTPFGMSLGAGAGARGFVNDEARDAMDAAGAWNARFLFGGRKIVGLEAAYMGSVGNVDALGLDSGASMVGTGVEGALRLHFLAGMWQPYAIAGAGWNHYQIANEDYNTSSIEGSDDMAAFPLGAGLAFHYERLVLDLRGVYRPTAGADLIPAAGTNLDTWAADLNAGFEF